MQLGVPWNPAFSGDIFLKVCQLKQLVDERHCSLAEAKKKLDAKDSATPTITRSVDDEDSGWNAVICDFIDKRRQVNRATTMRDLNCHMKRVRLTLEKKPRPQSGADLMKAYARHHFKNCPAGGSEGAAVTSAKRAEHLTRVSADLFCHEGRTTRSNLTADFKNRVQ